MKKHYRTEDNCLNCNANLQGKYCHVCGQENLQIKESFGHVMSHAISDYFHFDHQFFNTIKPLLFNPGKLTLEYMAGRRVQYLHPIKMYIFISLIYFLLLFQSNFEPIKVTQTHTGKSSNTELIKTNKELDKAINNPDVPAYAKTFIKEAKQKNEAELNDSIKVKTQNTDRTTNKAEDESEKLDTKGWLPGASKDSSYDAYLVNQQKMPIANRDGFFQRIYNKKSFVYKGKYGEKAREVFFEDIKHNIPKMMFLLLPLCALIFKITFWKNKKFYVEHLIFTFHLHCFIFLFFAVIMLLQIILPHSWNLGWLNAVRFIGVTWYLYRALRVFYQRSRWRTISKMFGAGIMYGITFVFCLLILSIIIAVV